MTKLIEKKVFFIFLLTLFVGLLFAAPLKATDSTQISPQTFTVPTKRGYILATGAANWGGSTWSSFNVPGLCSPGTNISVLLSINYAPQNASCAPKGTLALYISSITPTPTGYTVVVRSEQDFASCAWYWIYYQWLAACL